MVIHTLKRDYQVIYRRQEAENFEILVCQDRTKPEDTFYTLLRFVQDKEIRWLVEQHLLQKGITGRLSDYKESFIWQDGFVMVFARREGRGLKQWLEENPDMHQRVEMGKCLLERLLLLNMPEYLLGSILNEECILVTKTGKVAVRYEPHKIVCGSGDTGQTVGEGFYKVFCMLLEQEPQAYRTQIHNFLELLRQEPYQDVFGIYQNYERMQEELGREAVLKQETWRSRIAKMGNCLSALGKKLAIPLVWAAAMVLMIYGICHTEQTPEEGFIIEQIGTLPIR